MKTYNQYLTEAEGKVSVEQALKIAAQVHLDLDKYDIEQFQMGLGVEMEHADVTKGDTDKWVKIVLAHLDENPEYYTKLKKAGL